MILTLLRTVLLYGLLILAVRMMGKRQLAEMEPAEFVVTMLAANLAAIPMQDASLPLHFGALPIVVLLALELLLSVLALKSVRLRALLCGRPELLILDGTVDQKALRRSRVSMDELTEKLREKDVFDLQTVKHAILETDGELSVMLYPEYEPLSVGLAGVKPEQPELPYTIISDGRIMEKNLQKSGFDEKWLQKTLRRHNCEAKQVFWLTVDKSGKTQFIQRKRK